VLGTDLDWVGENPHPLRPEGAAPGRLTKITVPKTVSYDNDDENDVRVSSQEKRVVAEKVPVPGSEFFLKS
jgi:hypothetical protein